MYILLHFTHAHTDIAKERDKQQSNVYCLPVKLETSRIHIRRQKETKESNVYMYIENGKTDREDDESNENKCKMQTNSKENYITKQFTHET